MTELILLALDESPTLQLISRAFHAVGYKTIVTHNKSGVRKMLEESHPSIVLLGEKLKKDKGVEIIEELLLHYPTLPIVFLATENSPDLVQKVLRAGISAYLEPPLKTDQIVDAVESSLQRGRRMGDWIRREIKRSTASLEKRVSEMEVLLTIGRDITGTLDLDGVLNNVVAAAVKLTKAENGSLLLLDEESDELFMRAGYNFEDEFAQSFRLPVTDSLAGQVIKTGEPINLNKDALLKIKTAYLVQSLIYVPIKLNEQTIGVLGVDNHQHQLSFSEHDILLLSLLADYAVVAIENARLYKASEDERSKFEAVLSNMDDALIILDQQDHIQLINEMMCDALGVKGEEVSNKLIYDVILQRDILNVLRQKEEVPMRTFEVILGDDRVFNAQYTPIPGVGAAITMQDVSYHKELSRLKDDFVHTVSHDLRSPLTAVLGYAELIQRIGSLNEEQKEFVHRIQLSVQDITALINDLLDLGRIEAGFDTRRETIHLESILRYSISNLETTIQKKNQTMELDIVSDLPPVRGNPIRIRQLFDNLIGNAVKYTPKDKKVSIKLHNEDNQIIFNVSDQGTGIPLEDQPHIFEKFYRAANISKRIAGSGLGLAIVKTIVDSHQGRIWFESKENEGSTFFVLLPTETQ